MKKRVGFQFHALGGSNEVQLYVESDSQLQAAADAVVAEIGRIQSKFSRYQEDSVVSKVNRAAGICSVLVDEETVHLLSFAKLMHTKSGGLFDITSGVLRRAWDFKKGMVPAPQELQELRPLIGMELLTYEKNSIFLGRKGMEIDLGGIGKEFACDRAADILRGLGITSALVNLGGDVHIIGPHPDGRPWRVGITHPRKSGAVVRFVEMFEGCLATSGDYERYFELDGVRYCHILHPRKMVPVQDLQSVSVMSASCLMAGGLATTSMLLGEAGAVELLEDEGLPFFMVKADGTTYSGVGRRSPDSGGDVVSPETCRSLG
jgi:thiamine biosynthesis lipoprotein